MRRLLFLILFLASVVMVQAAATVTFSFTNSVGQPDTNVFRVIPVGDPILANGGVITRGPGIRMTPNASGFCQTNLAKGNFLATNSVLGEGIVFAVPDDANTYNFVSLAISGFNTYNYTPGVLQVISTDGSVTFTPSNGKGIVDLHSSGGSGAPFINNLNGNGTNTILYGPTFYDTSPVSFTNPADLFTGNGSGLTNLNASNISSGTVAFSNLGNVITQNQSGVMFESSVNPFILTNAPLGLSFPMSLGSAGGGPRLSFTASSSELALGSIFASANVTANEFIGLGDRLWNTWASWLNLTNIPTSILQIGTNYMAGTTNVGGQFVTNAVQGIIAGSGMTGTTNNHVVTLTSTASGGGILTINGFGTNTTFYGTTQIGTNVSGGYTLFYGDGSWIYTNGNTLFSVVFTNGQFFSYNTTNTYLFQVNLTNALWVGPDRIIASNALGAVTMSGGNLSASNNITASWPGQFNGNGAGLTNLAGLGITNGQSTFVGVSNDWYQSGTTTFRNNFQTNVNALNTNTVVGAYFFYNATNFVFSNSIAYVSVTNGHFFITNYTAPGQSFEIDPSFPYSAIYGDNNLTNYLLISSRFVNESNAYGVAELNGDSIKSSNRLNGTSVVLSNGVVSAVQSRMNWSYLNADTVLWGTEAENIGLTPSHKVTLPGAATNYGRTYNIFLTASGTNAVQTAAGAAFYTNTVSGRGSRFYCDGTNWWTIIGL